MKEFKASPHTMLTKLGLVGMVAWLTFIFIVPASHPPVGMVLFFGAIMAIQCLSVHVISYRVHDDWIFIHRPLWNTPFPKKQLSTATFDPQAFDDLHWAFGSRRSMGYCGRYSSRHIGAFRAYVTDPKNSVVLRFHDETIVVSPADPRAFLATLNVPGEVSTVPLPTNAHPSEGYFHKYW